MHVKEAGDEGLVSHSCGGLLVDPVSPHAVNALLRTDIRTAEP